MDPAQITQMTTSKPSELSISAGKEYYRFAHYLIGSTTFAFLLLWSFLPITETNTASDSNTVSNSNSKTINLQLLKLLPQRRWVIIGESIGLMAMLCAYVGLLLYDEDVLAVELDDYRTMVDDRSVVVRANGEFDSGDSGDRVNDNGVKVAERYTNELPLFSATSGVLDVPLMDVCEVLFSE